MAVVETVGRVPSLAFVFYCILEAEHFRPAVVVGHCLNGERRDVGVGLSFWGDQGQGFCSAGVAKCLSTSELAAKVLAPTTV
jgi:hypothetical protein